MSDPFVAPRVESIPSPVAVPVAGSGGGGVAVPVAGPAPSPPPALAPASPPPLPVSALRRSCDPAALPFETTATLPPPDEALGQQRALEALAFGASLRHRGYNVFALGSPGLGRHTAVREFLEKRAAAEPTPPDWAYVHDFATPARPRALRLPPGRGRTLKQDVERVVAELQVALPALLEGDDYRARHQALDKQLEKRREQALTELGDRAEKRGVALVRTPAGLMVAPTRGGRVIEPDDFALLPEAEQATIKQALTEVGDELQALLAQAPAWAREHRNQIRDVRHQMTQAVVDHHLAELRARHADLPEVLAHLDRVARELVEDVHGFASAGEADGEPAVAEALRRLFSDGPALGRYGINLIVDHGGNGGAPVVYEDRANLGSLVGRVEYQQRLGALSTDFTQIKAGALHAANGGYLILDVRKVLTQPFAYDELKRALTAGLIRVESVGEMAGFTSTATLQPEPIPLEVKVVLVGEREVYYRLAELDPDFLDLFKIEADFAEDVERGADSQLAYARLLGEIARREGLRPLHRSAVARVIEHGSRLAGDADKLSARVLGLGDLVRESDRFAEVAGRATIAADDVDAALEAAVRRSDRVRSRVVEQIRRGTLLIDTRGARIGCVNGLSVVQLGRFAFGQPTRITARVRPGSGEVIDIEREVELGGPLHSKGVLILSSFLASRFAGQVPFTLAASLVFEQSYGGVEGDSASAAELFALLSAIAEVPLSQALAVTGSVNQHGEVQPIGGVNEKVEGFYDVCRATGLTGDQGVLVPAANVKHLMLRRDVVEAAAAGRFRVFSYATIDEGIALLGGLPAGERDPSGQFPAGSLNARVEARLARFAQAERTQFGPQHRRHRPD